MKSFEGYARHYDALYSDKDYAGEASYVASIIKRHVPSAKSIIDIGCGTGRHAIAFMENGFCVTGIDRSVTMLEEARRSASRLRSDHTLRFVEADIRAFDLDTTYDAAVAIFHVMSYLTTNDEIISALTEVHRHLAAGGLFVFDFWFGPGVLSDPPTRRLKIVQSGSVEVMRFATPTVLPSENVVSIDYQLVLLDQETGQFHRMNEQHLMRYYFKPEIEFLLASAGFQMIEIGPWMQHHELDAATWNAVVTARRI